MRLHKIEPGRYVWYLDDSYRNQIRFEFSRKYNFGLGFKISRGDERDLSFSLHAWKLFGFWITYEGKLLQYRGDEVTIIGAAWQTQEHVIRLQLMDHSEMDSSKPAILDVYWNYRDWLFGRAIYSEGRRNASLGHLPAKQTISLPEGEYELQIETYTSYWHRPRSPFVKAIERVNIHPLIPVPIPGKGENSYDLDDDAIYDSIEPRKGRTVEKIAEDFRDSILDRRERYASRTWVPGK